jgi:hypothetical protein
MRSPGALATARGCCAARTAAGARRSAGAARFAARMPARGVVGDATPGHDASSADERSASAPPDAWADLLTLRSGLLRDVGAAVACPPLLRSSRELLTRASLPPEDSARDGAAAAARWRAQLAWLRALDAAPGGAPHADALARLAEAKKQRRLGVYFQVRHSSRTRCMNRTNVFRAYSRARGCLSRRSAWLFGCESIRRMWTRRGSLC